MVSVENINMEKTQSMQLLYVIARIIPVSIVILRARTTFQGILKLLACFSLFTASTESDGKNDMDLKLLRLMVALSFM